MKNRSIQRYNEKKIENIDTYDTRKKVNTTKGRPIYEVIDEAYIKGNKRFPDEFIKECKDNSNEMHDIPCEVKNNLKRMAIEQGLYAQVVNIFRKDLDFVATDQKKIKLNLSFKVNMQDHNDYLILTFIGLK